MIDLRTLISAEFRFVNALGVLVNKLDFLDLLARCSDLIMIAVRVFFCHTDRCVFYDQSLPGCNSHTVLGNKET